MSQNQIVVVDDDPDARLLLGMAFDQAAADLRPIFVNDGQEAIDLLQGKPSRNPAWRGPPKLMLLDLRMPRLDGFEVLECLQKAPHLRPEAVVVFTTSHNVQDRDRAWDLGADGFIIKPSSFSELREQVCFFAGFVRGECWPAGEPLPGVELRQRGC